MIPDKHIPRIAITAGEPAGIGPDIVITASQMEFPAELVVIASAELIKQRASELQQDVKIIPFDPNHIEPHIPGCIHLIDCEMPVTSKAGQPDETNVAYVLKTLEIACSGCLQGRFEAMVTAPVHKGIINNAGYPFTGHTEYLAEICGNSYPVMMLADKTLRVALATTHMPLSKVSQAINKEMLEKVLSILHHDLHTKFAIPDPAILVCGLNPHAGEGGHLGLEEQEIIIPVLDKLRQEKRRLTGPVPADTAFTPERLEKIDAVLAMYHDQGLPVLKSRGFGEIVNITLGLPIIRTSVDHGTAFELAGTGRARNTSLVSTIHSAIELANIAMSRQ